MVLLSRLMSSLNKFGQLSRRNRRLLFNAILLLPIIHINLYFLGYYRLRGIIEILIPLKRIDTNYSEAEILQQARDIAWIVTIAAQRGLYKATCLRKSILIWWFLRKENIPSDICFGVRMVNRKLDAHAWVECNGIVVNDSPSVVEKFDAMSDVFPPTKSGL